MQFLDFSFELIDFICRRLTIMEQAALGVTCTSLYYLYPIIELKQLWRKKQVLLDINAIDYRMNYTYISERTDNGCNIRYSLWDAAINLSPETLNIVCYDSINKFKPVNDADEWELTAEDNENSFYMRKNGSGFKFIKQVCTISKMVRGMTIIHDKK